MATPLSHMKTLNLIVVLGILLICPLSADTVTTETRTLSPTEMETLVGPIALYPDALIAIILPASANATDVVLAARFLEKGGAIADADKQAWDESVRSLAHYPDVLKWMDENLEWTQQLGESFLAQQDDVMAAIQRLRSRALTLGNLPSTDQLTVVKQENYIRIVPTVPETIYVPYYDPDIIYVSRFYWGFGPAWVCGPWLTFDCNWLSRSIWVGSWSPRYFHRPAWGHIDRRPPPPQYTDRHTWRPDPRRAAIHPRPPEGRPGTIARPRPIINPNNPNFHRPDRPPAPPTQRPRTPNDDRRPPSDNRGKNNLTQSGDQPRPPTPIGNSFTRPPQTPPPTAPANVGNNNSGGQRPQQPASTQRSTQRPPRNDSARPATQNDQRPARDASRTRPTTLNNNPSASRNTGAGTAQRPSTPPPQRQTAQPTSQNNSSSQAPSTPPPARTTTRESSDSNNSSSSRTDNSSSSRNSSSSSSESRSSSSSYSSRQSSPPPAPRESRTMKPGAR